MLDYLTCVYLMRICQILYRTYKYGEIVQDLIYLKDFISSKSQVCER